ncbi:MAG TPA: methyltransferase domain-containing protein [Gemmata sp.]|nr:methyltransferase domain-containing protein [Gemmata sp.]
MMTLKGLSRYLVNRVALRRLPAPFRHDGGNCWTVELPELSRQADDADGPRRSALVLYEDGKPLLPPHALHKDIRFTGRGLFSHWQSQLYFSSSDNSDPNTNGRVYSYSVSPWLYRRRVGMVYASTAPSNHQKRDCRPEQIRSDVTYALTIARNYLQFVREMFPRTAGLRVLEIGPGINFGSMMVLAAFGMKPVVNDRFLAPWEEGYHDRFYAALAEELERQEPSADVSPIRALVRTGSHDPAIITQIAAPLEELPVASESIDAAFSNAVGEHLYDLTSSFRQLYRVTRPGGFGWHQVDFRDHRNFDRPLEFLLLEEKEFQQLFEDAHGECGNRHRPDETTALLRKTGFEVLDFSPNIWCPAEYLAEFLPRLRTATKSRFRDRDPETLKAISGCFRLRKSA